MNKRIKELAEQATCDIKDEFGNWVGREFDKEKFAELIVRECAKLLPPEMTHGPDGRPLEQVFKEHFGVEE